MRSGLRLLPLAVLLAACGEKEGPTATTTAIPQEPALTEPERLAKSAECTACHQDAHRAWMTSHHALAHRDVGTAADAEAYADRSLHAGDADWTFSGGAAKPSIHWEDRQAGESIDAEPPMTIGHTPLVQYLLATGDGRYQVPDAAWDPAKKEWFSIYGDENRRPEEWGHWTQRGMNWNSQCAWCHFTGLRKHYDPDTDAYASRWIEQGVGCAQCHGPTREHHGEGECLVDPRRKFTKEQWTHACATCHARREELDEEFTTGRSFHDHYTTALPSQPGLWYPDGQQLDEIYKFNSLMMSRMGHKGIGCTDCHDPHTATPKGGDLVVRSNVLCMTCHGSGQEQATIIDPSKHVFHAPGTPGASCVDCHMPKRPYMGRDPRSDHRFPRPDPLLTRELGVPNACNNCHADKGLDWQIKWTHQWYGEDMNAVSRARTRAIDSAQRGRAGSLDLLVAACESEEIDAWQATLLDLMTPWAPDRRVVRLTTRAANDGGPLARAAAGRLIARRGEGGPLFEKLLADPLKSVRVETGWAAFERLPADHPVVDELEATARSHSDQPAGAMRMARVAMARGRNDEAEQWFKRAAAWDRTSAAPRRDLAVFLSAVGRTAESIGWLQQAAELAPRDAEIPYLLALAYAETGAIDQAEPALREAVRLEPNFARAWYNLGLLYSGENRADDAIAALRRAEKADPNNADAPYARATILLRLGQLDEARDAAREALRRNPAHPEANAFLRQFDR